MVTHGCQVSSVDPALFLWHEAGELIGIIAVHVDDFLWSGIKQFESNIINKLRQTFKIGREDSKCFKYLGLDIVHADNGDIKVIQNSYVDSVQPITIDSSRKHDSSLPINADEKEKLSGKVGQLLWASNQTRPDISYEVCSIASEQSGGTVKTLLNANKAVQKLKGHDSCFRFQKLDENQTIT